MLVLGGWLHLMILEVFSNLWFYDKVLIRAQTICVYGLQSILKKSRLSFKNILPALYFSLQCLVNKQQQQNLAFSLTSIFFNDSYISYY